MTSRIVVVSGESGVGKTTVCAQAAALAQSRGLIAAGILSPPRLVAGCKVGLDVQDVRSGQKYPLAEVCDILQDAPVEGPATGRWHFHQSGLEWGAAVLRSAAPCDLLIVDELGSLEIERGQGWIEAMNVLRANAYRLAVVVVRPALVTLFKSLDGREPPILFATPSNRDALPGQILALLERNE